MARSKTNIPRNCEHCGGPFLTRDSEIKRGNGRFCSNRCAKLDVGYTNRTHGRSSTPLYKVYRTMIARCQNPTNKSYEGYGARGITVCERWLGQQGFPNFLADMGERPEGMSIERKDNDGPYSP